jgi:hypothetical protein
MARSGIRHGTRSGYDKHYRTRKGNWKWPLAKDTCGCLEAHQAYMRGYRARPVQAAGARQRSVARHRALKRLADMHTADYAKLYTEELSIIRDGGKVVLSALVAEMKRELAVTSEEELQLLVANGSATLKERAAYWRIQNLKDRIEEARARVKEREPDGAG